MKPSGTNTPFPSVVAFFAAAVGLVGMIFISYSIIKSRAALRWPVTKGGVVWSRIVMVDIGQKGSHWIPRAQVRFRYEVNGKSYESRTLKYRANQIGATNPDYEPEVVVKYPLGAAISVSYDPADPANAISDPFPIDNAYLKLAGSVLVFFCGTFYLARHRNNAACERSEFAQAK